MPGWRIPIMNVTLPLRDLTLTGTAGLGGTWLRDDQTNRVKPAAAKGWKVPSMNPTESNQGAADQMSSAIVAVARDEDRGAFQQVFEFFAPRVKAFVMRQGTDPQMAEEVAQETMVNVWRKAKQFDPRKASASTWVFTIARNLRIDHLRKASRPEPDINDPALVPDTEQQAPDRIQRRQEASRLRTALSSLPDEQRQVLHLAFFEDKPHAEVAAELNLPLGTVKSRIRLAMKRMRAELGEPS